jgi:hypothetical protein
MNEGLEWESGEGGLNVCTWVVAVGREVRLSALPVC